MAEHGVADLFDELVAPTRQIVDLLRELVVEVLPEAIEEPDLSAKLLAYTYQPGTYKHLIAAIAPHATHVNLMLAKGADLLDSDPHELLEGTGKKARHIKFRSPGDVGRNGVRELLAESAKRTPRP